MLKVLCFGNPNFKNDALALEVGSKIRKRKTGKIPGIEIIECGLDGDALFEIGDANFVVLDVVRGIEKVKFVDTCELEISNTVTAHDIDVSFYLKLLAKEGKKIRIIGIPEGMEAGKAAQEVERLLA
ncbi:MAG: hypothetical protein V1909_03225 [Candidatus Micrarchaeota archaeon]